MDERRLEKAVGSVDDETRVQQSRLVTYLYSENDQLLASFNLKQTWSGLNLRICRPPLLTSEEVMAPRRNIRPL